MFANDLIVMTEYTVPKIWNNVWHNMNSLFGDPVNISDTLHLWYRAPCKDRAAINHSGNTCVRFIYWYLFPLCPSNMGNKAPRRHCRERKNNLTSCTYISTIIDTGFTKSAWFKTRIIYNVQMKLRDGIIHPCLTRSWKYAWVNANTPLQLRETLSVIWMT